MEFDVRQVEDVLWSITERCNLKCVYCSVSESEHLVPAAEPTEAQVYRVLSQLRRLPGIKSIIISGGEFTLSRGFPRILRDARALCPTLFVITNGIALPTRIVEALMDVRPTVMVTVDSTDEASNAATRGPGVLKLALRNVDALLGMGLTVIVISVVTRHNVERLDEDLEALRACGVQNVLLQQLHCEGRADRELFKDLSPSAKQLEELHLRLLDFQARRPEMALDYNEVCFFPMRRAAYALKCDPQLSYRPQRLFMCGAAFRFFAIKTNGDVIPCNALRSCVLGNLYQQDLLDMLASSPEMQNLRRLQSLRVDAIPGCLLCQYNPICDGGCRADALHLTGDVLARHLYCPEPLE